MTPVLHSQKPFLTAQWHHIVMLNFEVAPEILRPYVPQGLEFDLWKGKAFVSLVGLNFVTKKVFGMRLPRLPLFEQVNLRFYARSPGGKEDQRGVVFIKEIVPLYRVSTIARLLFKQNYITCPMSHRVEPFSRTKEKGELVEYSWRHNKKWQKMTVHGQGGYELPVKGSREDFVMERYRGYAQKGPNVMDFQVEHPPWRIQPAKDATLQCEVGKVFGAEFEPFIQKKPAFSFLADGGAANLYYPHQFS